MVTDPLQLPLLIDGSSTIPAATPPKEADSVSLDEDIWSSFRELMERYDSLEEMLGQEIQPRGEFLGLPALTSVT